MSNTRMHRGVEHVRRWFVATLEPFGDGTSERFEAPADCELWPVHSPVPIVIDGEPFLSVLWSVAPEPLPTPEANRRPAPKRKGKRAKPKR